jgi:hypothetical protein
MRAPLAPEALFPQMVNIGYDADNGQWLSSR